jgi:SAM-dependent methyltransferase
MVEARRQANARANKKYYAAAASSMAYIDEWLQCHVPGSVFLDYACGNGRYAIEAARHGASLSIGLDISDVSVRNARLTAQQKGVDRCVFVQGDCEATELPDASVDVILCSGMLHHLDLNRAYAELRRILRPGGRVLAAEALGHNPLIRLYRELTPHLRTDWERSHILRRADIQLARCWFQLGEIRYWHLGTLMAVPLRGTALLGPVRRTLDALDRLVLSIPGVRLLAWLVTFELIVPWADRQIAASAIDGQPRA